MELSNNLTCPACIDRQLHPFTEGYAGETWHKSWNQSKQLRSPAGRPALGHISASRNIGSKHTRTNMHRDIYAYKHKHTQYPQLVQKFHHKIPIPYLSQGSGNRALKPRYLCSWLLPLYNHTALSPPVAVAESTGPYRIVNHWRLSFASV